MNAIKIIYILGVLLVVIYFGAGGLIILENDLKYEKVKKNFKDPRDTLEYKNKNGVTFKTKEALEASDQQDLAFKIFPHLQDIPSFFSFFITSICFGIIGVFSKMINDSIKSKDPALPEFAYMTLMIIQGGLIGILVLSISYVIPNILINESLTLNPISIVVLSLLGGVCYLDFFLWLESAIKSNVIKKTKEG